MLPLLPRPCFNVILASNTGKLIFPLLLMPVSSDKADSTEPTVPCFLRIKHNLWSPYTLTSRHSVRLEYLSFKLPSASWYTYQTFSVLRLGTCGEGVFYFLRYINYIIFSLSCQGKSSIFQRVGEANESRKIFIIHILKEAFQTSFFSFQIPYLFRYIYYIKEILSGQEKSF